VIQTKKNREHVSDFISVAFCAVFVVFLSGTAKAKGVQSRRASHSRKEQTLRGRIGCQEQCASAAVPCLSERGVLRFWAGSWELRLLRLDRLHRRTLITNSELRASVHGLGSWPYHLLFLVKTQKTAEWVTNCLALKTPKTYDETRDCHYHAKTRDWRHACAHQWLRNGSSPD